MKTVIEMALEAGSDGLFDAMQVEFLERFAELVRADERRAMMQLFTDPENQPTQHGTVTVEYMMREIADEREACAYKAGIALLGADRGLANRVDQAIRARNKT